MRFFILLIIVVSPILCYSQQGEKVLISAIILNIDSVPVTDVAIVSIKTGTMVRTNQKGFFQIEVADDDSLFAFHIAYKRQFIDAKSNGRRIILEPESHELMQVEVTSNRNSEQKRIDQIRNDIRRIAPMKTISHYDLKSAQQHFVDEQGSHTKGFSPYFGPTIPVSLRKITSGISKAKEHRKLKKLTSHYHLVKKKKQIVPATKNS
jgi:hypothetical protein